MPSVSTLISECSLTCSENRTLNPTALPSGLCSSSATRVATALAANRRGWVWPIVPSIPRPSSRQILGNWVVLPEPVSPAITTTWWSLIACLISSRLATTGRSGHSSAGTDARRLSRLAMEVAMASATLSTALGLRFPAGVRARPSTRFFRRKRSARRTLSSCW